MRVRGADEYIVKPFDQGVLRASVGTAAAIAELEGSLSGRVAELQHAVSVDPARKELGL